jgi:hypothetical protein
MNSEQSKLILVLVLFVVAGGVYFMWGRPEPVLKQSVPFVCVATGQVYELDRDDVPSFLPAMNPDTQEETLLPVVDRDGSLFVSSRYAAPLTDPERLAKVNKYVDPRTLRVLEEPRF